MVEQFNRKLILENGEECYGYGFGANEERVCELIFNTSVVGYQEIISDPAYAGQAVVMTYPLIGNYGVPVCSEQNGLSTHMDSNAIHPAALIMTEYSPEYSHWNANESLAQWLIREQIPAVMGIDTRALTKHLREKGSMQATLFFENDDTLPKANDEHLVAQVSCAQPITYNSGAGKKVVLVDCGVKQGIIRYLIERGVEVTRVPWDYDFNTLTFDALILSNGPGNPEQGQPTIAHIQSFLAKGEDKPLLGLDLGNQLLALDRYELGSCCRSSRAGSNVDDELHQTLCTDVALT